MKNEQPRAIGLNDLGQLTLRGNVAFAVRCALRIRPCFELPADAPRQREKVAAVDRAIRLAAAFCNGQPLERGAAAAIARVAEAVAEETSEFTRCAGYAAVRAAEAAANAEEVVRNPNDSGIMEVVAAAFGSGRVLAANADTFTLDYVAAVLCADVDKLLSLGHGGSPELGPPLDPSEAGPLGPLWPNGTPLWCSAEAVQPPHVVE